MERESAWLVGVVDLGGTRVRTAIADQDRYQFYGRVTFRPLLLFTEQAPARDGRAANGG